jgi:hypothetical protein
MLLLLSQGALVVVVLPNVTHCHALLSRRNARLATEHSQQACLSCSLRGSST